MLPLLCEENDPPVLRLHCIPRKNRNCAVGIRLPTRPTRMSRLLVAAAAATTTIAFTSSPSSSLSAWQPVMTPRHRHHSSAWCWVVLSHVVHSEMSSSLYEGVVSTFRRATTRTTTPQLRRPPQNKPILTASFAVIRLACPPWICSLRYWTILSYWMMTMTMMLRLWTFEATTSTIFPFCTDDYIKSIPSKDDDDDDDDCPSFGAYSQRIRYFLELLIAAQLTCNIPPTKFWCSKKTIIFNIGFALVKRICLLPLRSTFMYAIHHCLALVHSTTKRQRWSTSFALSSLFTRERMGVGLAPTYIHRYVHTCVPTSCNTQSSIKVHINSSR